MIELRCHRRVHAEIDDKGRLWEFCRECSKDRSTPEMKRRVFHRWDLTQDPPEQLKDVTYNDRPTPADT